MTVSPTLQTPPLSLYVHFPWCVSKCPYCDFNSHALHGELPQDAYLRALERDLELQAPSAQQRPIQSIFFGGGTPSLFAPAALARLLESIGRILTVQPGAEVTLEANPGTIERGRFADYAAAGINRVSLGAQSFAAEQLLRLGRIHSADDTRRAVEELHAAGLSNFNLDLMYGLPAQQPAGACADLEAALALEPAHLSHYQLTLEAGTVFGGRPPADLPDDEAIERMLEACQQRLTAHGFSQYEVSAYARGSAECQHNLNYWRFGDYLGIGAGAHGKLSDGASGAIVRTVREREPRRYLERGASTAPTAQPVSPAQRPFEFMLNALRLNEGFDVELFEQRTGLAWSAISDTALRLQQRGLLSQHGERWAASPKGWRFLNDLLTEFLPPVSGKSYTAVRKNPEAPRA
jgi:putative oxygen-independent coproporphyrinogen III oxidase